MNKLNTLTVLISQSFLSVLAQDDGVGSIRIICTINCKDSHGFYELSIEKCFSTLSNFKIRLCKHKCPSLWVPLGYFSETRTNLRVYLLPSKITPIETYSHRNLKLLDLGKYMSTVHLENVFF